MRWASWWLKMQMAVVASAAVLTGAVTVAEFYRYLVIGGDLAQFHHSPLPNPFVTPVFFAALGFTLASRLAWRQVKHPTARVEVAVGALSVAGAVLGLV
jgi:hypothetical protein